MKIIALLLAFSSVFNAATGQEAVYFFSEDSLRIRGDLYLRNNTQPFIILCHQDGSNRSEFYEIAPRLMNLNYNCLTIDLRAGGKTGFIQNETASRALSEKRTIRPLDAVDDIRSAIRYSQQFSNQPVILLGSSFSASLCLLAAAGNSQVKAVIALSPGEYFLPFKNVAAEVKRMKQPIFVSATQTEYPYIQKMFSDLPDELLTLFKPEKGKGVRGSGAFRPANENSSEYWFALMMFFKKIG